jgi:hypothetical protein
MRFARWDTPEKMLENGAAVFVSWNGVPEPNVSEILKGVI